MLTFATACSGIGAPEVAWETLGWRALWCAETDKAASLVLAHRFPHVPNHGDMLKLAEKIRTREIEAPDVFVAGTPCQSFSVAGLRRGLKDARGQLTLAYIEIINAMDEVRAADGKPPVIFVWENVPGVLNHEDNPFGCFLAGLAGDDEALEPGPRPADGKSDAFWSWSRKLRSHVPKWSVAGCVAGPQRAAAWRTLDAQYFRLAQRRRRVFAVGSAGEGFDPAAILLEFEGLRRDSPPSREAGEGVAGTLDARTSGGGFPGSDGACNGHVVAEGGHAGHDAGRLADPGGDLRSLAFGGNRQSGPLDVATACNAHGGPHGRLDFESETFVVEPVDPKLFSIMPMNSGRDFKGREVEVAQPLMAGGPVGGNQGGDYVLQPVAGTLTCDGKAAGSAIQQSAESGLLIPICFSSKDYGGDAQDDLPPTLRAGGHAETWANAGVPPAVAYSVALRGREGGATAELGDEVAGCLRASSGGGDKPHVLAPVCVTGDVTHTLKAEGFDASEDGTGRGQPIINVSFQTRGSNIDLGQDVTGTLGSNCDRASGSAPCVAVEYAVRRLMEVECERLQGFPDNHTRVPVTPPAWAAKWPDRVKYAAAGPRYKQLGNSMAVNVMRWIGERIECWVRSHGGLGHNGGPAFEDLFG